MKNINMEHTCTRDDRGLCETCETIKRDERLAVMSWAAGVVEETRVKMVKGVMSMEEPEVWEMDWRGMMDVISQEKEMVNA